MEFLNLLKPLLFYKKYILAERILKHSLENYIIASNEKHEQSLITKKIYPDISLAGTYLNKYFSSDSSRLIESISILKNNDHIVSKENNNLYEFYIKPTTKGETDYNNGFYRKKIIEIIITVVGIPTIFTLLVGLLKRLHII